MKLQIKWFLPLVVAFGGDAASAQQSLDLNFGLSVSKSILGVSYTKGANQINVGFRGLGYNPRDGVIVQPGVAYNRYLTDNGFYASLIYVGDYHSQDATELSYDPQTGSFSYVTVDRKGWSSGFLMTGLGKSWQFRKWGLHTDVGVGANANSDILKDWGIYFGAAASYRFKLGD